ncbi:MAG: hydrogenase [Vicinamibacterales bacterium]
MNPDNRLVFWGLVLFLGSLLTGLLLAAGPAFVANPRGVLAGHLEAAMNGMFLILVGLFFQRLRLSDRQSSVCRASLLYGAYANWVFTTLAGVLGTSESTPLAGAGHQGSAAVEQFILLGLVSVALATLMAVSLLLVGVRRGFAAPVPV